MALVLWLLRAGFGGLRPEWVVIGLALVLGYLSFVAVALLVGLGADDRLIARAIWERLHGVYRKIEVGL